MNTTSLHSVFSGTKSFNDELCRTGSSHKGGKWHVEGNITACYYELFKERKTTVNTA